ncbi:MAG: hypothetical protein MJZ37_07445 [Bacilli bacterium]|nr:hypothetical protein [Bacilli bacterium]
MEVFKSLLYVIASVIMGAVIWLCPKICDDVSIFYVLILTTYLGLDVWNMIKTTKLLPPGEFKEMKIFRYALCVFSYVLMIAFGMIQVKRTGIDLNSMFSIFISAIFILISLLIGGLEGNKIATGEKEE